MVNKLFCGFKKFITPAGAYLKPLRFDSNRFGSNPHYKNSYSSEWLRPCGEQRKRLTIAKCKEPVYIFNSCWNDPNFKPTRPTPFGSYSSAGRYKEANLVMNKMTTRSNFQNSILGSLTRGLFRKSILECHARFKASFLKSLFIKYIQFDDPLKQNLAPVFKDMPLNTDASSFYGRLRNKDGGETKLPVLHSRRNIFELAYTKSRQKTWQIPLINFEKNLPFPIHQRRWPHVERGTFPEEIPAGAETREQNKHFSNTSKIWPALSRATGFSLKSIFLFSQYFSSNFYAFSSQLYITNLRVLNFKTNMVTPSDFKSNNEIWPMSLNEIRKFFSRVSRRNDFLYETPLGMGGGVRKNQSGSRLRGAENKSDNLWTQKVNNNADPYLVFPPIFPFSTSLREYQFETRQESSYESARNILMNPVAPLRQPSLRQQLRHKSLEAGKKSWDFFPAGTHSLDDVPIPLLGSETPRRGGYDPETRLVVDNNEITRIVETFSNGNADRFKKIGQLKYGCYINTENDHIPAFLKGKTNHFARLMDASSKRSSGASELFEHFAPGSETKAISYVYSLLLKITRQWPGARLSNSRRGGEKSEIESFAVGSNRHQRNYQTILTLMSEGKFKKNRIIVEIKKKPNILIKNKKDNFLFTIPIPLQKGIFSVDIPYILSPAQFPRWPHTNQSIFNHPYQHTIFHPIASPSVKRQAKPDAYPDSASPCFLENTGTHPCSGPPSVPLPHLQKSAPGSQDPLGGGRTFVGGGGPRIRGKTRVLVNSDTLRRIGSGPPPVGWGGGPEPIPPENSRKDSRLIRLQNQNQNAANDLNKKNYFTSGLLCSKEDQMGEAMRWDPTQNRGIGFTPRGVINTHCLLIGITHKPPSGWGEGSGKSGSILEVNNWKAHLTFNPPKKASLSLAERNSNTNALLTQYLINWEPNQKVRSACEMVDPKVPGNLNAKTIYLKRLKRMPISNQSIIDLDNQIKDAFVFKNNVFKHGYSALQRQWLHPEGGKSGTTGPDYSRKLKQNGLNPPLQRFKRGSGLTPRGVSFRKMLVTKYLIPFRVQLLTTPQYFSDLPFRLQTFHTWRMFGVENGVGCKNRTLPFRFPTDKSRRIRPRRADFCRRVLQKSAPGSQDPLGGGRTFVGGGGPRILGSAENRNLNQFEFLARRSEGGGGPILSTGSLFRSSGGKNVGGSAERFQTCLFWITKQTGLWLTRQNNSSQNSNGYTSRARARTSSLHLALGWNSKPNKAVNGLFSQRLDSALREHWLHLSKNKDALRRAKHRGSVIDFIPWRAAGKIVSVKHGIFRYKNQYQPFCFTITKTHYYTDVFGKIKHMVFPKRPKYFIKPLSNITSLGLASNSKQIRTRLKPAYLTNHHDRKPINIWQLAGVFRPAGGGSVKIFMIHL